MLTFVFIFVAGFGLGLTARELYELLLPSTAPTPRSTAIELRRVDEEHELELSDGRRYRSVHGIIWYSFPEAHRVNYHVNEHLEREFERLQRLEKWTSDP